jgi:hypothetical protein
VILRNVDGGVLERGSTELIDASARELREEYARVLREIGAIANGGRTRLLTDGITGGARGGGQGAAAEAATTTVLANNVVGAGALYQAAGDAEEEEEDVFVDAEESFAAEDEGAVESI